MILNNLKGKTVKVHYKDGNVYHGVVGTAGESTFLLRNVFLLEDRPRAQDDKIVCLSDHRLLRIEIVQNETAEEARR